MKKIIVCGLASAMIAVASVTTFAGSTAKKSHQHKSAKVEVCSESNGACRHGGCGCKWYVRATGGAGKCICGHWDYMHN